MSETEFCSENRLARAHGREFVPVPEAHGYWQLVPVLGETG